MSGSMSHFCGMKQARWFRKKRKSTS